MCGNCRLAVVEAKSGEKSVDAGEAQARRHDEALGVLGRHFAVWNFLLGA